MSNLQVTSDPAPEQAKTDDCPRATSEITLLRWYRGTDHLERLLGEIQTIADHLFEDLFDKLKSDCEVYFASRKAEQSRCRTQLGEARQFFDRFVSITKLRIRHDA